MYQVLRQHSRNIVRSFGFLSPTHPSGLPFSKVHALVELGEQGPLNAKQLAELLCLEKSSISRLVQSLQKQGLITVSVNTLDERSKILELTRLGQQKLQEINHDADHHIQSVLQFLTPEQRKQVEAGLKQYAMALKQERLCQQIQYCPIQAKDDKALEVVSRAVLTEFNANREGFAFADPELTHLSSIFNQPGWYYLVCKQGDTIMGGCGIGPLQGGDSSYCELKKMYLAKESRGLGLGKCLLNKMLSKARDLGYQFCYLETLSSMHTANYLYQQFGFEQLNAPLGETGHFGCDRWYLKEL